MKTNTSPIMLAAVLLAFTSGVNAESIINGSFEGSNRFFSDDTGYGRFVNPGQDNNGDGQIDGLDGWNVERIGVAPSVRPNGQSSSYTTYPYLDSAAPGHGDKQFSVFGSTPFSNTNSGSLSLSQTISGLSVGQSYEINFWTAGLLDPTNPIGWPDPVISWQVYLDNTLVYTDDLTDRPWTGLDVSDTHGVPGPVTFQKYDWEEQNFSFTASGVSQVLKFVAVLNGQPVELSLDGISIQQVPEPTSALLFGFAGMGAMFHRRRNKR